MGKSMTILLSLVKYFNDKTKMIEGMDMNTIDNWDKNLIIEALVENFIDDVRMWENDFDVGHEDMLRTLLFSKLN